MKREILQRRKLGRDLGCGGIGGWVGLFSDFFLFL